MAATANRNDKSFMGTEPIGSLLIKLSVPAMIGMIVNALYNFVDTIFVGQGVGPLAIAGLSIAFPLQMLIGAFAQTFGIGSASIISRRLGEKNEPAAACAAGNAITATVIVSLIFMAVGLSFTEQILSFFGATEEILPYAMDYVEIILLGAMFLSLSMTSNGIIRAEGQAKVAMTVMLIGTGLNLVFDPVFIFVFDLGIRGAAMATVLSQFLAFLFVVRFFRKNRSTLPLQRNSFIPKRKVLSEIVSLGIPAFVRQSGTSLMVLLTNNLLKVYAGGLAIASFGMINKLLMFVLMPLFGIVQGFQPIAGYNYGARKLDRVKQVLKTSMGFATILATAAWIVIQLFPKHILSVFSGDISLLSIATPALRISMLAIPLVGIQAIGSTLFQSIGKRVPSIFLSLTRQFIFLIPILLFLPNILGINGVWIAFPLADALSTLVTFIWVMLEVRNLNRISQPY
ncbi:MAG: MATE family efflux transporter [Sphaerochaetaceae bacterium]|nr:MATE family efflux transporter [Sphaerochaetaceae bacterium]